MVAELYGYTVSYVACAFAKARWGHTFTIFCRTSRMPGRLGVQQHGGRAMGAQSCAAAALPPAHLAHRRHDLLLLRAQHVPQTSTTNHCVHQAVRGPSTHTHRACQSDACQSDEP